MYSRWWHLRNLALTHRNQPYMRVLKQSKDRWDQSSSGRQISPHFPQTGQVWTNNGTTHSSLCGSAPQQFKEDYHRQQWSHLKWHFNVYAWIFFLLVFDLPNNIKIKSACSEIIVPCMKGRTEGMLKVRKWDASSSWAILFFKIAVVTHVFAIALCIMYIQDSLSSIRISFHICIFSVSAPWRGVIHEVVFIY